MHRLFANVWIPAWLCLACAAPALAAPPESPTPPAEAKKAPRTEQSETPNSPDGSKESKPTEPLSFIRLVKDKDGTPLALETAIVRYVPQSGEGNLTLDLIAAVHVGDRDYYQSLNKRFEGYDALLYELVAEKGTRIPKGGRPGGDLLPVEMMKKFLDLDSQLELIDYTKKNFVHADLSPQEMREAMKKRGEDGMTLTLGILRDVLKEANRLEQQQAANAVELPEITLTDLLFSSQGAKKMKRFMAHQLSNPEMMGAMGETLNTLLISDRNQAALKVFQTQLANGKQKMALFYGAAHMPDFEKRLVADYGLKRERIIWVTAWEMR